MYEVLQEGTGESPKASDTVKVHYRGMFLDGKEFGQLLCAARPPNFRSTA